MDVLATDRKYKPGYEKGAYPVKVSQAAEGSKEELKAAATDNSPSCLPPDWILRGWGRTKLSDVTHLACIGTTQIGP